MPGRSKDAGLGASTSDIPQHLRQNDDDDDITVPYDMSSATNQQHAAYSQQHTPLGTRPKVGISSSSVCHSSVDDYDRKKRRAMANNDNTTTTTTDTTRRSSSSSSTGSGNSSIAHRHMLDGDDDDESTENQIPPTGYIEEKTTRFCRLRPLSGNRRRLSRLSHLLIAILATIALSLTYHSFINTPEAKGCRMPYMRPSYVRLKGFDTSKTRFASKYSLFLYREQGLDDNIKPSGVPVLFIPGNAGSYRQVRSLGAKSSEMYAELSSSGTLPNGPRTQKLDFFAADFNEDFTAFHGRTLLDQAEFCNDAIKYILSLYQKSAYPRPTAVILVGHSMGGVVARTMVTLSNYAPESVNTIITLSTPHAVAPATYDWDIVRLYKKVNRYWRDSYSYDLVGRNPLVDVTLVSISGGKLDQVVPSDYAAVSSLVPPSNGFTVFTSGMPQIWTSVDHQAIAWCDQIRTSIAYTLLSIVDGSTKSKTLPVKDRMNILRRNLLSGLEEDSQDISLPSSSSSAGWPDTLLKLTDISESIVPFRKRLVITEFGDNRAKSTRKGHLFAIPPESSTRNDLFFNLLTNQPLSDRLPYQTNPLFEDTTGRIRVLLCKYVYASSLAIPDARGLSTIELHDSDGDGLVTELFCKDTHSDAVLLPPSTYESQSPTDEQRPMSFLQYNLTKVSKYDFIAVLDMTSTSSTVDPSSFLVAETVDSCTNTFDVENSNFDLAFKGRTINLPCDRATMIKINLKAAKSGLLSYHVKLIQGDKKNHHLFAPLLRQFVKDPYESKFFVNFKEAIVSAHGSASAPFVPHVHGRGTPGEHLHLQLWVDGNEVDKIVISVDILKSLGNLVMRYRTALTCFPLTIVAIVIMIQIFYYDRQGVYMSFHDGLWIFSSRWLGKLLIVYALLSFVSASPYARSILNSHDSGPSGTGGLAGDGVHNADPSTLLNKQPPQNEFFLGMQDSDYWFLGPIFLVVCTGCCVMMDFVLTRIVHLLGLGFRLWIMIFHKRDYKEGNTAPIFERSISKGGKFVCWRRWVTMAVLAILVATVMPFQFAFIVVTIVQLTNAAKAYYAVMQGKYYCAAGNNNNKKQHHPSHAATNRVQLMNFYNFSISLLTLLIWIVPVNVTLLIVWVHNLSVHWKMPFSSHHNLLSVMPVILCVEKVTSGHMLPRSSGTWWRLITILILSYMSWYASCYGMMNAYWLHHIANIFCGWLLVTFYVFEEDASQESVGVTTTEYEVNNNNNNNSSTATTVDKKNDASRQQSSSSSSSNNNNSSFWDDLWGLRNILDDKMKKHP